MSPRIAIVIASTRPERVGAAVGRWVHDQAAGRDDATFEIVDLAAVDLPLLDEPVPAAMSSDYAHEHTRRWSRTVAGFDAFVFVTPEHNHSVPASLKNAIDYLFTEWHHKAAGFVSYGLQGGTRAVEHLRQILAEVRVADARVAVALSLFNDFTDMRDLNPGAHQPDTLDRMLTDLVALTRATATLRTDTEGDDR